MADSKDSRARAWLYRLALLFAASLLAGSGFRLFSQIVGAGTPSIFTQSLGGLMVGFALLILYGYWTEYRAETARGMATTQYRPGIGCLLMGLLVSGFLVGLLVLAWKMLRR